MSLQYRETIDCLYGLKRLGIRPGLESTKGLLHILGNPESGLPIVHIAGTNGKGSTSAMIASVMKAAGYRVGLFTSPHLLRFNERFRVSGTDISDEELYRVAATVLEAAKKLKAEYGLEATFFEAATAMAWLYFREQKVELAIMETGMGGRLDATNAAVPLLSIITSVALDHSAYLGVGLGKIAAEKAGIIKKGIPIISGVMEPVPAGVIDKRALELNNTLPLRLGHEFHYEDASRKSFDYFGVNLSLKGLKLALRGAYQRKNAAIAMAALELLRESYPAVNEAAIREGLKYVDWPGRFESISTGPAVILDCAHNPHGARALRAAIREYFPLPITFTLVTGISKDKDIMGILRPLLPLARRVILTEASIERAAPLVKLREAAKTLNKECEEAPSVERAIASALRDLPAEEVIVICGSIFVVGEAREFFAKRSEAPQKERVSAAR